MKLLNEKAVNDRFIAKYGIDPEESNYHTEYLEILQDHYGFEVVETYDSNANFYIFEESTADGYSVYVATCNLNSICVSDEVHYYSSNLSSLVEEVLMAGDTLAIDQAEDFFIEAVENLYSSFVDVAYAKIEEELINEGYVEAITNPKSTLGLLDMVHQKMKVTESDEYIFCMPEQVESNTSSDIRLMEFYTQILLDCEPFRKYARKVLNCYLSLPNNNTIQLNEIPLK